MKRFFPFIALIISSSVFASTTQPRHNISIGTDGLGWSAGSRVYKWDEDVSGIDKNEATKANAAISYNYIFENLVMLGIGYKAEVSNQEFKDSDGNKQKKETTDGELSLSLGYNFNQDLFNSWWVKGTWGTGHYKDTTKDTSGKSSLEFDYNYLGIGLGKRISLSSWGLANVSYNPSIRLASADISGDAEDNGLESATEFKIEIIKIDLLF
jgi:hypothetical protein